MSDTITTSDPMLDSDKIQTDVDKKIEYQNAVNTFYSLKNEYDEQIKDLRKKISKKKGLSVKEKRDEFKKIKPQCVNCKRKVGSIFEVKYNKTDESRIAKAICGDRLNRCPLDIEINLGKITPLSEELQNTQDEMNTLKKQIVVIKNDLLFGYISTDKAVEEFDKIKSELSSTTEMYEILLVSYVAIYDNPEKASQIKRMKIEIYNNINMIKQYIRDFEQTKNLQFVHDAVTLLITQLTPKTDDLRKLKYPITTVNKNDKPKCNLIQKGIDYAVTETDSAINEQGITTFKIGIDTDKKREKQPSTNSTTSTSEYRDE